MNIQERRNKDGKITSYRIRVFDHRDTQTYKQVFRTLSIKYDISKSEAWNRKNAEKQGMIFEKQIEEHTVSDSHITFDSYCEYAIGMKEQAGLSPSTIYSLLNTKSKNPGVVTIKIICDGLEISVREFFDSDLFNKTEQEIK